MEKFDHTLRACSTYPIVPFLFSFVPYPSRRVIWSRKARMHTIAVVNCKLLVFWHLPRFFGPRAAYRCGDDHSATPFRYLA